MWHKCFQEQCKNLASESSRKIVEGLGKSVNPICLDETNRGENCANSGTSCRQYSLSKGRSTLVKLPRIVTPYRDSVDGTRAHVTYQKLVTR